MSRRLEELRRPVRACITHDLHRRFRNQAGLRYGVRKRELPSFSTRLDHFFEGFFFVVILWVICHLVGAL